MTDAITVGALADAYPAMEEAYRLTLRCLRELIRQGRGFTIGTKGLGVLRDAAILAHYAEKCAVFVSLCTLRDDVARRIERSAPSATDRLRLVRELKEAGVRVWVSAAPWIPGITDAARFLEHIPSGVPVQFAPIDLRSVRGSLAGRRFTQAEVNRLYLDEFASLPKRSDVFWVAPVEPGAPLNCLHFL